MSAPGPDPSRDLPAYEDLPAVLPVDRELRLRPWSLADAPAVAAALDDRGREGMPGLRTAGPAEALAYVTRAPEHWAARRHLRLCVTDGTGAVRGSLDLTSLTADGRADLAWWTAPEHRGRQQGVRAARLGVRVAWELLGLRRLRALVHADNAASRWVAAGAGLHREAVLVAASTKRDGSVVDDEVWRLLRDEEPLEPQPELTAGRLHLRPLVPGDADDVLAACQDPEVQRWTSVPVPYTREHAVAFTSLECLGEWASGRGATWAVVDSTTAALLACVGMTRHRMGVAEVGYWAVPAARGQGVVTDAVGAGVRWALGTGWSEVVEWRALTGNEASRRVAAKAGFTEEGLLRSRFAKDGLRSDVLVASRLPGDA